MKHETLWFRLCVGALVVAGALALTLALHGRHRPPADDAKLPGVVDTAPQTPTR